VSLIDRMRKFLKNQVQIYRLTEDTPDPLTGASSLIRLKVLEAQCSLQAQRRIARSGEVPLSSGMPLEPPAYKAYLAYAPLPPAPYEALEVWVDGLRYPLQRPPIDVAGQHDLYELHLGAAQEGALDRSSIRSRFEVLELSPMSPHSLSGSGGQTYALITPTGGNSGSLEYSLNGLVWLGVSALLELSGSEVQAALLRNTSSSPLAVRVDYY